MIRDKTILVNGWLLSQLRIFAELKGMSHAEEALELIVRERLNSEPDIEDLARRRAQHKKQADAEWREAHGITKNELPTGI